MRARSAGPAARAPRARGRPARCGPRRARAPTARGAAGRRRRRWRPSAAARAAGPSRRRRRGRRRCGLEAQRLGVLQDGGHGLAQARVDDALGDPGVELAAEASPRGASRGRGWSARCRSARPDDLGVEEVGGLPPTPPRAAASRTSRPSGSRHRIREWTGRGPPSAMPRRPRVGRPASTRRRKWARYPLRQLVSRCTAAAPTGSTGQGVGQDGAAGGAGRASAVDQGEDDPGRVRPSRVSPRRGPRGGPPGSRRRRRGSGCRARRRRGGGRRRARAW